MKIKLLILSILIAIGIIFASTVTIAYDYPITEYWTWQERRDVFSDSSSLCNSIGGSLYFDGFFRVECSGVGVSEKECTDVFNGVYEQCNTRKYTTEEIEFLGVSCLESSCIIKP